MSSYANTTLSGLTIDLKWDMDLLEARYAESVIMPRILNKSANVTKSGERVSIQIRPLLTTAAVAAGGGFTPTNAAPTQANINVTTWNYVAIEIDDQARAQSFWDPTNTFPQDAAKAIATDYDTTLGALHGSLTGLTAVGDATNPTAFDDVNARVAMLRLAKANIPKDNRSFILPPEAFYVGWYNKAELTAAHSLGIPKSVLTSNFRTPILGVPSYESNLLTTVGTATKGFLLHKEAMGIAIQLHHKFYLTDRKPALVFGWVASLNTLYGTAVIRSNHGVVINVRQENT